MEQPAGELRFRSSAISGVSFPERTIELVVMPYEEETLVEHKGKMIREIIARGAFEGIQRRTSRIKVNRDHDERRVVGRAVALHPSRDEGLVAELRISNTPLGDETLTLADDGVLDASAGYLPLPGGEKWLTRSSFASSRAGWAISRWCPSPPTRAPACWPSAIRASRRRLRTSTRCATGCSRNATRSSSARSSSLRAAT